MWTGAPQRVFSSWLATLDGWVRKQLGEGVLAVADMIELHARHLEDAQSQVRAGTPGVACPAPVRPVGSVPGQPPEFVMVIPRSPGPVAMAPDQMQALVTRLGEAKDVFLDRVAGWRTPSSR